MRTSNSNGMHKQQCRFVLVTLLIAASSSLFHDGYLHPQDVSVTMLVGGGIWHYLPRGEVGV